MKTISNHSHLRDVSRPNFLFISCLSSALLSLILTSCSSPTAQNSQANVAGLTKSDYTPRVGVAVKTNSHICVALKNAAVENGSPITLVIPNSPQRFVEASISGPSKDACPITKELDLAVDSYTVSAPDSANLPKLAPMFGVLGSAASGSFFMENISVQADLDQTHSKNTFRACGANDGVHLSIWHGNPLSGALLWSGHYYQEGNPGTLPTCSTEELATNSPEN